MERGIIGIGWRMDELPEDTPLATVVQAIEDRNEPGWGRAAAQTVRRFGDEAEIGDFVWTRDTFGRYLLCRINGPYRYDISDAAKAVDVHQVRLVEWAPKPLNTPAVALSAPSPRSRPPRFSPVCPTCYPT